MIHEDQLQPPPLTRAEEMRGIEAEELAQQRADARLCCDCAWFLPDDQRGKYNLCMKSHRIDRVFGRVEYWHAQVMRDSAVQGDCGPEGIHWQAKEEAA